MKKLTLAVALLAAGTAATSASAQNIQGPTQIVGVTTMITNGNPTYPLSQIADGIFAPTPFNGFQGTDGMIGTLTFNLDKAYDIDGAWLWNDINVRAEGVKSYSLNFYDAANNQIGGTLGPFNTIPGQVAAHNENFAPVNNVKRVDMVIHSVQNVANTYAKRVEIREVAFNGKPSGEPPFVMAGDHYQCYRIPESKPLAYENLQVSDQFGRAQIVLGRPVTICNPSTKVHKERRFKVSNPRLHLVCYDLAKQSDQQRRRGVRFNNQMGPGDAIVFERQTFCVPSIKKLIDTRESPLDQ